MSWTRRKFLMLGCASCPRRCAGEVPLGVEPAPGLVARSAAFVFFEPLLDVVPIVGGPALNPG